MPTTRKLFRSGNSIVIALSSDQLAHLHRDTGDQITIDKAHGNRLIISPGRKTLRLPRKRSPR